jgi:signal transduction histidine kinase
MPDVRRKPLKPTPGHLGLKSMQERVKQLGGTLVIESVPGEGAVVRVNIPVGS